MMRGNVRNRMAGKAKPRGVDFNIDKLWGTSAIDKKKDGEKKKGALAI